MPSKSLETFLNPLYNTHQAREMSKSDPSEIGFPMTLTSGAFLNQKAINKPVMNNLRILLASVFHFVFHPVEKYS